MKKNKIYMPWLSLVVSLSLVGLPVFATILFASVSIPMTIVSGVLTLFMLGNCVKLVKEVVEENKMISSKQESIRQEKIVNVKEDVKNKENIETITEKNKNVKSKTNAYKLKKFFNDKKDINNEKEDLHIQEDENIL